MCILTCCLLFSFQMVSGSNPSSDKPAADFLYWIELTQLKMSETGDWGFSGEISPLVGLEPGMWLSPLSGLEQTMKISDDKPTRIAGRRLYLPRHMIRDGTVHLFFSIQERDDTTPDDLLLPTRCLEIPLTEKRFANDCVALTHVFRKMIDINTPPGTVFNTIEVGFRLTRRPIKDCGLPDSVVDADTFFRQQNEIHRLRQIVFHFFDRQIFGGKELAFLNLEGSADDRESAESRAALFAQSNAHEVEILRRRIERYRDHPEFATLKTEFNALVKRIREGHITIKIYGQKERAEYPLVPQDQMPQLAL